MAIFYPFFKHMFLHRISKEGVDQRVQEPFVFLSLVEIQTKRITTSSHPDEILMESCIHMMTLVLFLYFTKKEPIPDDLITANKHAFQFCWCDSESQ